MALSIRYTIEIYDTEHPDQPFARRLTSPWYVWASQSDPHLLGNLGQDANTTLKRRTIVALTKSTPSQFSSGESSSGSSKVG